LGDQSTGATTCVQLKNGGKNSPCWENIAVAWCPVSISMSM
jgi:hypothetical protein